MKKNNFKIYQIYWVTNICRTNIFKIEKVEIYKGYDCIDYCNKFKLLFKNIIQSFLRISKKLSLNLSLFSVNSILIYVINLKHEILLNFILILFS